MNKLGSLLTTCVLCIISLPGLAQDEDIFGISKKAKNRKSESSLGNAFRSIQEMFSFEISSGVGLYEATTEFYKENGQRYPITQYQNVEYGLFPLPDTLSLRSMGWVAPSLEAGVRLNLFNIITLGGGYGMERGVLAPLQGAGYEVAFNGSSYRLNSYYASAGLILFDANRRSFFLKRKYNKYIGGVNQDLSLRMERELNQRLDQNYPWRIAIEGKVGQASIKSQEILVPKAYLPTLQLASGQFTYGAAIRLEYDLSEYASIFLKGEVELRSLVNGNKALYPFPLDQRQVGIKAGISMRMPGTKMCKIQGCGVVMKHMHNNVEYRGSSIFNLQNRKVGQW
ncbi:MAG: hypothetical protein LW685_00485 [Algoriphagus sp.]|nr:hypothetical protein [Algoriphagus sp.]